MIIDKDHRWLFKIRLDDKFDFEDTSDENVGKMSKYLETKILSIANSNHAAITESIKEELIETARSFNFIHSFQIRVMKSGKNMKWVKRNFRKSLTST